MERRRACSTYAKLREQQQQQKKQPKQEKDKGCEVEDVENNSENEDELPAMHRSHSVRASLRRLKSKLHSPALPLQSPFKLRAHLHSRSRKNSNAGIGIDKSKVVKALRFWHEIDAVAVVTTKVKGEFVPLKKQTKESSMQQDHELVGIEQLMSSLPVGVTLPRKACKLLQIPETYSKTAPHATVDSDLERTLSNPESPNATDPVLADITQHASQGIYGTTRMRTATIRKPMPYLNSRRCYQVYCTPI